MLFFLLTAASVSAQSTSTREKFIKCTNLDPNSFYVGVKKIPKPYLKKVVNSVHAALINSNYAHKDIFQTVGVEAFCDSYTNATITNTLPPVVKIIEGSDFYYLTNYLGQSTGSNETDSTPDWAPLSFNGLPVQKYLLPRTLSKAMLDAWGYYPNATVSSRNLNTIPNGTALFSNSTISAFPKNVVLYCGDRNEFYRAADYNNNLKLLTRDNIGNYVPSWAHAENGGPSIASFKLLLSSAKALCEFNSAGVRKGSCTLPKEIVYVNNCATAGTSSKPVNFLSAKRQGAVEQIDGQYYTFENDVTVPTRVFQYAAGSLREVTSEPNQAWADLLATIPSISDCAVYPGYIAGIKRSHEKRIIGSMSGANPRVPFSSMKLVCLKASDCGSNGYAIYSRGECHSTNHHFGNSMNSDGTSFKANCINELVSSCAPPNSEYRLRLCGKDGVGDACTDNLRSSLYDNCQRIYNNFANSVSDIQLRNLITKCSPWRPNEASGHACNIASAYADGRRNLLKDAWSVMQSFLITNEGSPGQGSTFGLQ